MSLLFGAAFSVPCVKRPDLLPGLSLVLRGTPRPARWRNNPPPTFPSVAEKRPLDIPDNPETIGSMLPPHGKMRPLVLRPLQQHLNCGAELRMGGIIGKGGRDDGQPFSRASVIRR